MGRINWQWDGLKTGWIVRLKGLWSTQRAAGDQSLMVHPGVDIRAKTVLHPQLGAGWYDRVHPHQVYAWYQMENRGYGWFIWSSCYHSKESGLAGELNRVQQRKMPSSAPGEKFWGEIILHQYRVEALLLFRVIYCEDLFILLGFFIVYEEDKQTEAALVI